MRILTVRQPWAWAIVHGQKDVENRSRNIAGDYRGPVAIHAGKANDTEAWAALGKTSLGAYSRALGARGSLITGAIIGVVDLVDVHLSHEAVSQGRAICEGRESSEHGMCSPWGQPFVNHLVLANPRSLATPIPFTGALGLRELDAAIEAHVWAEVRA